MEPYKKARGRRSEGGVTTRSGTASEARTDATTDDLANGNPAAPTTPADTPEATTAAGHPAPAGADTGPHTQDTPAQDTETATPTTEQLATAVFATFNVPSKESQSTRNNE
jgi:hypothetical protein